MAVRRKVQSEHYVNNKEFLEALIVFKAKCAAAKKAGNSVLRSATTSENAFEDCHTYHINQTFVNYMFREDMICDGIENCVQYARTLIQRNLRTLLHTSLRSFTMPS